MSGFGKKSCPDIIYLDNNATTLISQPAANVYKQWLSCYNASSDSKVAEPAKKVIEKATDLILSHCKVSSATHTVVFTSGATESNCFIIKSCIKAYTRKLIEKKVTELPHVITSTMEHHSILECLKSIEKNHEAEVTYISPTIYGLILPEDIEKEIKPHTCLISVMLANNEVPVINNLEEIGKVAHRRKVPVHSDCVQIFGKYRIDMEKHNIDALSASAHKFCGPKGIGLLIVKNQLIEGYGLEAEIHGSQQHGLRGGTENVPAIASMAVALRIAFVKRKEKNNKLFALRAHLLESLAKWYKFGKFEDYVEGKQHDNDYELVSLGPSEDQKAFILPNTVFISLAKNRGKPFCNVKLKNMLDKKNVVVSIGSACLTKSDSASHVLTAIGAPPVIKRGVLRISFGDHNTMKDVNDFVKIYRSCVESQLEDLKK